MRPEPPGFSWGSGSEALVGALTGKLAEPQPLVIVVSTLAIAVLVCRCASAGAD